MNINNFQYVKDNKKMFFVSVVVPMYNEEPYIKNCLLSLINQDYPKECYEIIVIDGNSTDNSKKIVTSLMKRYPFIKMYNNPKRITPVSFNTGIKKSRGEIIIFVGAHAICENDYISQCVYLLNNSDASNVGGIQNTVGTNYVSNAISYAMTSPFGVGNAYYHFSNKEKYVESVWGGAYKKETLIKLGGFNEDFIKNQDYELNYRLRKMGGKIFLSPKIKCEYFVRDSLKKLISQHFGYGFWKVKTINEHPDSIVYRQIVPPLFVISLFIFLIILIVNWKIGLFIPVPVIYLAISILYSIRISHKKGWNYLLILPLIFILIHISWGVGFIFGLKKFGVPKIKIKTIINSFYSIKL